MTTISVVLGLITRDNDYQQEQARVAEESARRLGVNLTVVYAEGDAIAQTKQLLGAVQAAPSERPTAIIVEPVGTGMLPVATSAVRNGIGWIVLNREADSLEALCHGAKVPIGSVECDNTEVGRIQGRQLAAILPTGGSVLYIEGPGDAAKQRRSGLDEARPRSVDIRSVRGKWTEESGTQAVAGRLPQGGQAAPIFGAIASQNDAMAMGARKAVEGITDPGLRAQWLRIPFLGVDGIPTSGKAWVDQGQLAATIVVPALTGVALELLVKAIASGNQIPTQTLATPVSYPVLGEIRPVTG